MEEKLKNKLISIIPDDPEESKEEKEARGKLKIILSKTRTPLGDFKKILEGNKDINTYLNIAEILDNLSGFNFSLDDQSKIVLFLLENNIKYFNQEYLSDMRETLEYFSELEASKIKEKLHKLLSIDKNVLDYVLKTEIYSQIDIAIKYHNYVRKFYSKLKKYFKNGKLIPSNISDLNILLINVGVSEKLAKFIISESRNEEIKNNITYKVDLNKSKKLKEMQFELNKFLTLIDCKYVSKEQIDNIVDLMKKLDYSEDDINKKVKEIEKLNFQILEEERQNKIEEIKNNYLSTNEIEILNKANEYKNSEYSNQYGLNDTLGDIDDVLEELVKNFDEENVELLRLLVLELSDELLNIELITQELKYIPNSE